jgi:hypothetical protein
MYLINFRSRVNPKSKRAAEEFSGIGGAYVNCWINFKDYEAAEKLAKILIRERGFIPEKKTDAWLMQKKHLKTKRQRQYYAEAMKHGYSLVFNLWAEDAPDADSDYEAGREAAAR